MTALRFFFRAAILCDSIPREADPCSLRAARVDRRERLEVNTEEEEPPPDRETVEKELLRQMQMLDDKHGNTLLPEQARGHGHSHQGAAHLLLQQ